MPVAVLARSRVITPEATFEPVHFFMMDGTAAVWRESEDKHSGTRLALTTGATFTPRISAREDHIVTLADGTTWSVRPIDGGGCGCGFSVFKGPNVDYFLDPQRENIP